MNQLEIIKNRLINQQISETNYNKPQEIVEWMIAMQAQEYAMAKWAIGLRLNGIKDSDVEKAFNEGKILRTHVMRPTWHFVGQKDIRWLLALTAPRIKSANAFMDRKLELDTITFKKCIAIIVKALKGGKQLTRAELNSALEKEKIFADGHRSSYIMMRAELDGIICSGARVGKQFTYALLEERVPATKTLTREEALVEFTRRYFTSRGPATAQDFSTWSGLTVKDVKEGIAALPKNFVRESMDGKEYIFLPNKSKTKPTTSFLMPDYDEYGMGYKDRSAIFNPDKGKLKNRDGNPVFNRMIIIDGVIEGSWRRIEKGKSISVETFPFQKLNETNQKKLDSSVKKYISFMGKEGLE